MRPRGPIANDRTGTGGMKIASGSIHRRGNIMDRTGMIEEVGVTMADDAKETTTTEGGEIEADRAWMIVGGVVNVPALII